VQCHATGRSDRHGVDPIPPVPTKFQVEGEFLYRWATARGATNAKAERICGLLNLWWMLRLPLPLHTHRQAGTPDYRWHRYLFRRHIQHILQWTTRREEYDPSGFGEELNRYIHVTLFSNLDEEHGKRDLGGGSTEGMEAAAAERVPTETGKTSPTIECCGTCTRSTGSSRDNGIINGAFGRSDGATSASPRRGRSSIATAVPAEFSDGRSWGRIRKSSGECREFRIGDPSDGRPGGAELGPCVRSSSAGGEPAATKGCESPYLIVHVGANESREWQAVRPLRVAHWKQSTIQSNVKGPSECGGESEGPKRRSSWDPPAKAASRIGALSSEVGRPSIHRARSTGPCEGN
jgi:hypothetical protein